MTVEVQMKSPEELLLIGRKTEQEGTQPFYTLFYSGVNMEMLGYKEKVKITLPQEINFRDRIRPWGKQEHWAYFLLMFNIFLNGEKQAFADKTQMAIFCDRWNKGEFNDNL